MGLIQRWELFGFYNNEYMFDFIYLKEINLFVNNMHHMDDITWVLQKE